MSSCQREMADVGELKDPIEIELNAMINFFDFDVIPLISHQVDI
jgi:hypothetical protein